MPLIMRAPWLKGSVGKRTAVLAELIDIFPSVTELAGLRPPEGEELDGKSLAPVLAGWQSSRNGGALVACDDVSAFAALQEEAALAALAETA